MGVKMSGIKEYLENRLMELNQAVDQSAANHNAILGRRAEVQHQLAKLFEEEIKAKMETEEQKHAA